MDNKNLMPCPFCGSETIITSPCNKIVISCMECPAEMQFDKELGEESAMEKWNKREIADWNEEVIS